ncbi:MAG: cation:proton antiporter [Patescibacteria group bacterium]
MEFFSFFIILLAAVFFSEVFSRFHVPWVVTLMLAGVVIGPFGFGWVNIDETTYFLGQIGLVFLMFMAGLEIRLSDFWESSKKLVTVTVLNAGIPFLAGMTLALGFGMETQEAFLLGIIFISSSVGVIIPSLEASGILSSKPGKLITPMVVFEDIFSLLLIAVFFQMAMPDEGGLGFPLWLFLPLLIISVIILRILVVKIKWLFTIKEGVSFNEQKDTELSHDFRVVMTVMIGTVVIFSILGLHPIAGGFFAGLILSDVVGNRRLKRRFKVVGYGIFIPIFFVIIGVQTDVGVLFELDPVLFLAISVTLVSMSSKFLSGFLGARLVGMSTNESALLGAASISKLSIALAVAFTGVEAGLISEDLATSLVFLTLTSTLIAPILVRWISKKLDIKVV